MSYSKIFVVCVLFLFGCKESDNPTPNGKMDSTCVSIVDDFFRKMDGNNYRGAIDDLLLSNGNINPKDSATLAMKDRFFSINAVSGNYKGRSLLKKRSINNSLAMGL
jgi:hypothetical protein